MIATDPLSLIFLACFAFSGIFLLVSTLANSGHTHALHFSGHHLQIGHGIDHSGHVAHDGHVGHGAPAAGGGALGGVSGFFESVVRTLEDALNLYGILTFLLIFGLLGYLLHNSTNAGAVFTVLVALVVAAVCAVGVSTTLTRLFFENESHGLSIESSRLEGRLGQVSMTIREGGVGEVIFKGETGGRQSLGARSADGQPIANGAEVVILASSDGIATVQEWDSFMASVRSGETPQLKPLEKPE